MRILTSIAIVFLLATLSWAVEKPNVVVILSDDQGWGDLSIHGNPNLKTPQIDSLAKDGASFDRFFVQPVCSPTRAEFLTGRWHPRGGVRGVSTGGERLDLDEKTIADSFKAAGYATACFGKWHNGTQYPYHPRGRGFDEYFGFTSGHWGEYFDAPLDHNGNPVRGKGYLVNELTDRTITFLRNNAKAKKPAFCYLALNTPHSPMQVPDAYWKRFENKVLQAFGDKKEDLNHTRAALAMCENIDDNVGKLLRSLTEIGVDRETIVVYFCDNGPNGGRWNGGMKGRKGSTDEGGVRSPLFVRWPGKIKPGTTIKPIAGAIDLLPTITELAGVKHVGTKALDGSSMAPWLIGGSIATPERTLFSHWAGKTSARDQRFRLDTTGQLFDMVNDPSQRTNIASEKPEVARLLNAELDRWKREVLTELPKDDVRPFSLGHHEFPRTDLPARDGVPHGAIKRSANAPNCSFFTNWQRTDDSMTWNIKVQTTGKYEAIVNYTCDKAEIGSEIELSVGRTKWSGQVDVAWSPPLRGQENDRSPRQGESYVKDFRPKSLGVHELTAGEAVLTLKALKVANKNVADIRSITLILQP